MHKYVTIIFLLCFPLSLLAEEIELLPIRPPTNPYSLEDIDSQVDTLVVNGKVFGPAMYRNDKDFVNWGHEATHAVNSRIRRLYNGEKAGFYILNNKAFIFNKPNIRISFIANIIPHNLRHGIFDLYLIKGQRDWDDEPLYLFDEFSAYINGTQVGTDYKLAERTESSSKSSYQLAGFCLYLLREIDHRKIKYEDYGPLKDFWLFQVKRLYSLSPAHFSILKEGLTSDENMLQWMKTNVPEVLELK